MKQPNFFVKERGFTMIELIITIAILSFGVMGIYELFYPIVLNTHVVSLKFTASTLAQEGLEVARNMRDNNFIASEFDSNVEWSDGLLECETGCRLDYKTDTLLATQANALSAYDPNEFLKINADGLYGYESGSATRFKREIIIEKLSPDILNVTANVYFDYNSQNYIFTAEEYLYNWY